jgi:hypothetical protein
MCIGHDIWDIPWDIPNKISRFQSERAPYACVRGANRLPGSASICVALESSQQVSDEYDQQDRSQANASAATVTPTAMPVVSAATAEKQNQQNDNHYGHLSCPFIWSFG